MTNQVLNDFITYLGEINFDCSGGRMNYTMQDQKMVFTDSSVQKMYSAYRKVLANGYRMGQHAMYNSMSLAQGEFIKKSMALAPK